MARVSLRGLARELEVNPSYVHRLVQRGVVQVGADGLIDAEPAKVAIAASKSIQHGYMAGVNDRQRQAHRPPAPPPTEDLPDDPGAGAGPAAGASSSSRQQFEKARTIRESYNASLARLQYQKLSGQLIERALAQRVLFDAAREARDAWLGFSSSFSAMIAADLGLEPDRVAEVLTTYVRKQIAAIAEPDASRFDAHVDA